MAVSMAMHTDDLSSDDDQENRNTVGRGESRFVCVTTTARMTSDTGTIVPMGTETSWSGRAAPAIGVTSTQLFRSTTLPTSPKCPL